MSRDKGHFSVELRHGDHVVKALQYKHVTLHPNFGVGLLGEIVIINFNVFICIFAILVISCILISAKLCNRNQSL